MRTLLALAAGLTLVTADLNEPDGKQLVGTWIVTSSKWCGKPLDLKGKEDDGKPTLLKFTDDHYEFVGLDGDGTAGTYRIDPSKTPKEMDLTPTKGEDRTACKCVYALNGDELTIAFTLEFSPGTPEAEARRAKEMKAKRPSSITPGKNDAVLVLMLRRQKN